MNNGVDWISAAASILNPKGLLLHRPTPHDLVQLSQLLPPPPPALQKWWMEVLWRWGEEPAICYLLRCLAHQFSITQLSARIAIDGEANNTLAIPSLRLGWPHWDGAGLEIGTFLVVGLHGSWEVVQAGWTSCGCFTTPSFATPSASEGWCERCCAPRCSPLYTPRCRIVVERLHSYQRLSAVVTGRHNVDCVMRLGRKVVLHYYSRVGGELAVHSADELTNALPPCLLDSFFPPGPSLPQKNELASLLRGHDAAQLPSDITFQQVCRAFAPHLLGREREKEMLVLCLLYMIMTSYQHLHTGERNALSVLLVGSSQSGKTSLLRAMEGMGGTSAKYITSTVVNHESGLKALWPHYSGNVLCGGAALLSDIVLLDSDAVDSQAVSLLALTDLMREGVVVTPAHTSPLQSTQTLIGGGGSQTLSTTTHVVVATTQESTIVKQLLPNCTLVVPVETRMSMQHSMAISDRVLSSTRVSSSQSPSGSTRSPTPLAFGHSQTISPSPTVPEETPRMTWASGGVAHSSFPRLTGGTLTACVMRALRSQSAEDVEELRRSAEPFFLAKLTQHALLLERASRQSTASLPPPAALRGLQEPQAAHSDVLGTFHPHLHSLLLLCQARTILRDEYLPPCFSTGVGEAVWAVYEVSLLARARLMESLTGEVPVAGGPATAPSCGLAACAAPLPTGREDRRKRQRPSKKALRIAFARGLSRRRRGDVCPIDDVAQQYDEMGGFSVFDESLDTLLLQLSNEGILIRRPGGWRVMEV